MEITKQYIAIDSIIARPTKSVRDIVPASSGCWAIELNAVEIALASPSAGAIDPIAIHAPDVMIEITPTIVTLSILLLPYPYSHQW